MLRTFIRGLILPIQEIVAWKEPETLEAAISWAQRKEANLADMAQPDVVVIATPTATPTRANIPSSVPTPLVPGSTQTDNSTVTRLVEEFRDLKLFLVQGQNLRSKSPGQERPTLQRSVQFVTCHGCGKKGHYKSDCPDHVGARSVGGRSTSSELAEVNLLEFDDGRTNNPVPEVMVAKRYRPMQDIEPPMRAHHKRRKNKATDALDTSRGTEKRHWRKIGIEDMLLSKGQHDYSIIADLGKQPANITVGQLIARCPSLRRELRQGISTRRNDRPTAEI